jgi:DNA-binding transcriptional MerR regulator
MPLEQALRLASVGARTLHGWVEQGLLHAAESPEGQIKVCHVSLRRLAGRR